MLIQTNYSIGDVVYFVFCNVPQKGIVTRIAVQVTNDNIPAVSLGVEFANDCYAEIKEKDVFSSKEEMVNVLLDSL